MGKSKLTNKIIIAFILITIAIIFYRIIFLGKPLRKEYEKATTKQIDAFLGGEKGFCS